MAFRRARTSPHDRPSSSYPYRLAGTLVESDTFHDHRRARNRFAPKSCQNGYAPTVHRQVPNRHISWPTNPLGSARRISDRSTQKKSRPTKSPTTTAIGAPRFNTNECLKGVANGKTHDRASMLVMIRIARPLGPLTEVGQALSEVGVTLSTPARR